MMPQFLMGIDHFLVASLKAKYTNLIRESSVGNDNLFWVYFLILPFRFSSKGVADDSPIEVF